MKNYFENSPVNWNNWNPSNVIFKSNSMTKKLLPSDNVLSWKTKHDRNVQLARITGGKQSSQKNWKGQIQQSYSRDNVVGVMVQLKDLKTDYPTANIDFIDCRNKTDSVGNSIAHLDLLVYVHSLHSRWNWYQNAQGHYQKSIVGNTAPLDEGYLVSVGGQGDSNPMSFQTFSEVVQISEAIRKFLTDRVVPYKMGELVA